MEVPVRVDFAAPFPAADPDAWDNEYAQNVIAVDAFAVSAVPAGDRLEPPQNGQGDFDGGDIDDDRDVDDRDGDDDGWDQDAYSSPDLFVERADDPLLPDDAS